MKDLKIRAYVCNKRKLELVYEVVVDGSWRVYDQNWFLNAFKQPLEDLDFDQQDLRLEFIKAAGKDALEQGDLLCIGGRQCYIIY